MIYTFYSYKGGVGRSMAMANVGELFYQAGLNVLLVDWDLEAPGLERFFARGDEKTAAQPGVIDLLLDYKHQVTQEWTTEDGQYPFKKPADLVIDLHPHSPKGGLWLLTAGQRDKPNFASYANAVLTFDWKDFYDNWEGEAYFEWLREQFLAMADVVLIDSRTGITEMGGVCTYQLGDVVVMFCGTSQQSLDGTDRMVTELKSSSVEEARGRPLEVIVIPARVDKESGVGDEFRREFLQRFAQYTPEIFERGSNYFWQLTIPYATVCAYKEMIVKPDASVGSEEVYKAFNRLTFGLSRLAPDNSAIRKALPETNIKIGNVSAIASVVGGNIVVGEDVVSGGTSYYQISTPQPVDEQTLDAARERLADLPLDHVPDPAPLPQGSRISLRANPLFVGREDDLRRLAKMLKGRQPAAIGRIAAVTGLGGIGKTQLASEFAHRYGQFFTGGVFWLNFADPQAIPSEIASCGGPGVLDLHTNFGQLPIEDQVRLVLSVWQNPLPRLLIFDNCEDEALLEQWCPPTGGARVIVTSRQSQWDATLGVHILQLDVLPRAESVALLHQHRPDLHTSQADTIAEALSDLPLALHMAGSFLSTYRHARFGAPEVYLKSLLAEGLRHPSLADEGATSTTAHEKHVGRTFALSYQRLNPQSKTDAVALALLARSAYFAPGKAIPRALLLATLNLPENDLETERQAEDALARLVTLGLIETEAEGGLILHRLLAAFVRQVATDDVAQSTVEETLLDEAHRLNNAGFPAPLLTWQPHLRAVTDAAVSRGGKYAAGLCNELGYHLMMIADYAEARPYLEYALEIREATLGPDHPAIATCLNNLASLLKDMGDLAKARPYYEQALAIREATLGPEHPDTALSLNNLGSLLQTMGDLSEARPYYERALAITEATLGPDHPNTARSLNNLGLLLKAIGDLAGALPYLERALTIWEAALGPDHPDTATSLNNLGGLLQAMGDLDKARMYYERALAIREATLGIEHPDTALSFNNLGGLLRDLGDIDGANSYYERALAIYEATLGPSHPDTALSLHNLAILYYHMNNYEKAASLMHRALEIREMVLGPDHLDTAQSLNGLAVVYACEENLGEAARLMRRALAIREAKLGLNHPDTQSSRDSLSAIEAKLNRSNV